MNKIKTEKLITLVLLISILPFCSIAQGQKVKHLHFAKEVTVFNFQDSVKLAGTLTAPDSSGSFPLAIFISGSGPQDRYQSIGKHKPFLVLSNKLNQLGFATLYFDDRGKGKSGGDMFTNDFQIEMEDHQLILESAPEIGTANKIKFTQIGLIGHSLGGIIALELSREHQLDFSVLLATPFEKGTDFMLKQKRSIESLGDAVSQEQLEEGVKTMGVLYELLLENKNNEALDSLLYDKLSRLDSTNIYSEKFKKSIVHQLTKTALFDILQYDPMQNGYSFDAPTLFVCGSKDLQVPPEKSIQNLDQVMKGKISNVDYILHGGLNHLLQKSKDGSPMGYVLTEEAINEMVVEVIGDWLEINILN